MMSPKDAAWFCRNVEQLKQTMFRVAFSILRNTSDSEDAASNAVLKAFQSFERLNDKKAFRTWIIRILKNECYALIRKRKPTLPLNEEYAGMYELSDSCIDLNTAFERLSSDNRIAITLYYLEGYRIAEIAAILDVPIGTIKSRLSRARADLKTILADTGLEVKI